MQHGGRGRTLEHVGMRALKGPGLGGGMLWRHYLEAEPTKEILLKEVKCILGHIAMKAIEIKPRRQKGETREGACNFN